MMKYIKILLIAILCLSAWPVYASEWGIGLNGGYNVGYAISDGMQGKAEQFMEELKEDYNSKAYPFGEDDTRSMNLSLMIDWKPDNSGFSYYLDFRYQMFYRELYYYIMTAGVVEFVPGDNDLDSYTRMYIMSLAPGVKYTIGSREDLWNTFFKAGVNISLIDGIIEQGLQTINIPGAYRGGFDLGIGGLLNLSSWFSLELSMDYHNCNLIGKSFTKPLPTELGWIKERELNDAANPDNPDDSDRNIVYFCFGIGLKFWL